MRSSIVQKYENTNFQFIISNFKHETFYDIFEEKCLILTKYIKPIFWGLVESE